MSDHRKPSTTTTIIASSSDSSQSPDSTASASTSTARRPIVSRMRSRGRSITSTDPSNPPLPPTSSYTPIPSTSTSTSLLASPSLNPASSPNLLPQQLPFRNRAPTLTLALPSSQLSTVLEPDTPDKPYGPVYHPPPAPSSSGLVPGAGTNGVRSRSSSVGQAVKGASIVVSGEVGEPGSEGGGPLVGGQHPSSRAESSAQGRASTSYDRPSSSMGLSSSSSTGAPGSGGWLPAERIIHGSTGRALGRVGELFRSNSASSTSAGKQREHSPSTSAARRWAGERKRDSFSDEEEGRPGANGGRYHDDEDGASLEGSEEGSESSLNIKLHNSQLHLPLYPPKPPHAIRRPTLTFTAPPPLTPPQSDSPTSFSPTDPSNPSSAAYFSPWSASLPTPALSSASLSAYNLLLPEEETVVVTTSTGGSRVTSAQLATLARGMVPTLVGIAVCFVASLLVVLGLVGSLPIPPHLRTSLPKSTGDIRLLSDSITDYMSASRYGMLHTLVALGVTGIWTHAWSVPGSVVLNILLGALLPSIPAVLFLTLTTTIGGLCSYLLSRPLSPIILLLFPTQLAIVRSSITSSGATWRKLLVMRATGLVPWSGMNVACGVVGVRWEVFCGTFAGGSLSWNYVTSQIGAILMRISLPPSPPPNTSFPTSSSSFPPSSSSSASPLAPQPSSESLSSLLRDPTLIAKLIALSLLTLLPVLLKPKTTVVQDGEVVAGSGGVGTNPWWGVMVGGGKRAVGQGKRWMGSGVGVLGRWAGGVLEVGGWGKEDGRMGGRMGGEGNGAVKMREGLLGGR